MLIAAAVWPAKSDSWGRKKTLTFCLSATAALFGMQALSELSSAAVLAKAFVLHKQWGFSAFLLARFATGLFAGTNPIFKAWQGLQRLAFCQAYLADVVPTERLPFYMVFREASATAAFVLGPLLGGYLTTELGITGPFVATLCAHLVGSLLLGRFVEETTNHSEKKESLEEEVQKDRHVSRDVVLTRTTGNWLGLCWRCPSSTS